MKKLLLSLVIMLLSSSVAIAAGSGFQHGIRVGTTGQFVIDEDGQLTSGINIGSSSQLAINSSGQIDSLVFEIQAVSPNTGATTSMTTGTLLIYNGATVATANIVLPASPVNGQVAKIVTKPAISQTTVTGGTKTVNAGATSFSANTAIEYMFSDTTDQWHKSQ